MKKKEPKGRATVGMSNPECLLCGDDNTHLSFSQADLTGAVALLKHFSVWVCRNCSSSFLHPKPSESELLDAYSKNYYSFETRAALTREQTSGPIDIGRFSFWQSWLRPILFRHHSDLLRAELVWALRSRPELKVNRILELGCGDGTYTTVISELFPRAKIYAQDKYLKLGSQPALPNAIWINDIVDIQPNSIDLIIARNVIEHFVDSRLELQQSSRLLTTDGILVGELPNRNSFDRILFSKYWFGYEIPRHIIASTPKGFNFLCRRSGLRLLNWRTHPVHGAWIFYLSLESFFKGMWNVKLPKTVWKLLLVPLTIISCFTAAFGFGGTMECVAESDRQ